MKTVIVTGSCGLVGAECVRQFDALEYCTVGIDNDMRAEFFGPAASTQPMWERLMRDVRDFYNWRRDIRSWNACCDIFGDAFKGPVAAVIHTAAQPSHDWAATDPHTDFGVNAVGTLNLLEATRLYCPGAAFVFCSTNKVYGDTPNRLQYCDDGSRLSPCVVDFPEDESEGRESYGPCPEWLGDHGINEKCPVDQCTHSLFGASKLAADVLVQEYGRYFGMNTVCFRGGCLTGPGHAGVEQHGFLSYLVKCAVTGKPYTIIGYGGKQVRDNIHASDLVRAFVEYVDAPKPGAVYNIGGGPERSCSVLEAIALAESLSGRKMNVEHVAEARKGDHKWWITDTRKFEADYPNWQQRHSLEDTIREIAEAHSQLEAA